MAKKKIMDEKFLSQEMSDNGESPKSENVSADFAKSEVADNNVKKKKDPQQIKKLYNRFITIFTIIFIIGIGGYVAYMLMLSGGDVEVKFDNNKLTVTATLCDASFDLDDITHVELLDSIEYGRRTNGLGNNRMNSGAFKSDKYGDYLCACYVKNEKYIVVRNTKGDYIVFNQETAEDTVKIFDELRAKCPNLVE